MNTSTSDTLTGPNPRQCERCGLEFQPKRPLEGYCSGRCRTLALEEWARDRSAEERKFWRDLFPFVETALAWVDSLPERYALGVLRDIHSGNTCRIRDYFRTQFGRESTPHELAALHNILTRSGTWRKPKDHDFPVGKYLRVAVWRRGQEILVEWGLPSRWRKLEALRAQREVRRRRAETRFAQELLDARLTDDAVEPGEAVSEMRRTLRSVALSSTQRDLMKLLKNGLSPAAALEELGLGWSVWQSLQRKARRALAKKTLGRVSSRRSDAA